MLASTDNQTVTNLHLCAKSVKRCQSLKEAIDELQLTIFFFLIIMCLGDWNTKTTKNFTVLSKLQTRQYLSSLLKCKLFLSPWRGPVFFFPHFYLGAVESITLVHWKRFGSASNNNSPRISSSLHNLLWQCCNYGQLCTLHFSGVKPSAQALSAACLSV